MKRVIFILMFILSTVFAVAATPRVKALRFYFLTHDDKTPVRRVYEQLQQCYRDAMQFGDSYVFYLSNSDSPIVVQLNTTHDNREDFERLIGELVNKSSHKVSPGRDVPTIIDIMAKLQLFDEDGRMNYSSVRLNFYISSLFWQMQYNESLLASLYFSLDVPRLKEQGIEFNVFTSQDDVIIYDEQMPFGPLNLGGINESFILLQY